MIRVLHYVNSDARGGVEEHVIRLLLGLDRGLFRPVLGCSPEVARLLRHDVPDDVEVLPFHVAARTWMSAAAQFARVLRERRIGILHSHLFQSSLFASPIGKLCRVPVIIEQPHLREEWRHGWVKGSFFVDRTVGRLVDRYIAVSAANAAHLIQNKKIPARKIEVIYPITNLTRFDKAPAGAHDRRRDLFGDSALVMVVVGRLEPQKGHAVLLRAMPDILREFPQARLVLVGTGTLQADLERQVREAGIEKAVHFAGYQANVREWFAMSDISVLPSFYEGLPMVAIESMAARCPMVASAVDGTPEVILDGHTGFTCPAGDAASLAEAIRNLLRDPALRLKMGEAGRRFVLETFNEASLVRRTQDLYLKAWEQRCRNGAPGLSRAVSSGAE